MILFYFKQEIVGKYIGPRAYIKAQYMRTDRSYEEISVYYKFSALAIWEIRDGMVDTIKNRIGSFAESMTTEDLLVFTLKRRHFDLFCY